MKLLRKYNYIIIILVFFVILFISFNSYERTKKIVKSKYEAQNHLVENSVISALLSANGAYSISEKSLNDEMEKYTNLLLREYKSNPNISSWNLHEFKNRFSDYDIYVIDSNLKIIKTTFEMDLGMDFSKYKSFAKLLRKRLEGNSFFADKMDISTNTGKIKKYSYMPTPDHKYLLELSIAIYDRYPVLEELNVFSIARELVKEYKSVDNISFYKFNKELSSVGLLKDQKNPINTDVPQHDKALIKDAILSNKVNFQTIRNKNYTVTDKYIPFLAKDKDGKNDWWNSYVVRITYNNKEMLSEINKERNSFIVNITIIAVFFLIFIAVMLYLLKETEFMAYHDHLTGLANRKAFENYFNRIIRSNKGKHAILYIDLDNFKSVNDKYGHKFGDELLKGLGRRLKSIVRIRDKVSRAGGDEFIILLTDISSKSDLSKVIKKLEDNLSKPFNLDGVLIKINCSIGVSIFPEEGFSLEELINKADLSMYQVKGGKC